MTISIKCPNCKEKFEYRKCYNHPECKNVVDPEKMHSPSWTERKFCSVCNTYMKKARTRKYDPVIP